MKSNYSCMVLGEKHFTTPYQPLTFCFNKATHDYTNHFNY